MVAAQEDEHELVRVRLVGHGLDGLFRGDLEEAAEALDGVRAGRRDLLERQRVLSGRADRRELRLFVARGVVAVRAVGDVRLAGVGEHGELVGVPAADGAVVGLDGAEREAHAVVDVRVGVVHLLIGDVHALDVFIEGVEILHDELAAAHEAEARAALVAELVLDLIEQERQLLVAPDLVAHEVGDHLLVRRPEAEVPAVAVLHAHHLISVGGPAAALLPELGGLQDGHHDLLAARGVHLLADDLLDLADDAPAERQERVHAARDLADEPRAVHELMADDLRLRGRVPKGWCI